MTTKARSDKKLALSRETVKQMALECAPFGLVYEPNTIMCRPRTFTVRGCPSRDAITICPLCDGLRRLGRPAR